MTPDYYGIHTAQAVAGPGYVQMQTPLVAQTAAEKLRDLHQLREGGILSQWELEQKKAQVISARQHNQRLVLNLALPYQ